jgi:hypothetical protein
MCPSRVSRLAFTVLCMTTNLFGSGQRGHLRLVSLATVSFTQILLALTVGAALLGTGCAEPTRHCTYGGEGADSWGGRLCIPCDAPTGYSCPADSYGGGGGVTKPSPPPDPVPNTCNAHADCGATRQCANHQCEACGDGLGPCPCLDDTQCVSGLVVCHAGACTANRNVCRYSSECGVGRTCADGDCVPSCDTASCDAGSACVLGACMPEPPSSAACYEASDCGGKAWRCASGHCTESCRDDAACGAGRYCNQGACMRDARPIPTCNTDAQCVGSQVCNSGYCAYRCTSDATCQAIDSRVRHCASDSTCRTAAEANPQCMAQNDCPAGEHCVGNRCGK